MVASSYTLVNMWDNGKLGATEEAAMALEVVTITLLTTTSCRGRTRGRSSGSVVLGWVYVSKGRMLCIDSHEETMCLGIEVFSEGGEVVTNVGRSMK